MANKQEKADVIIIGAGPAGYPCAIRLAQLGKKVTVIEKGNLGGVCLNVGCIPSKALIHCGTLYEKIQHAGEFGFEIQGVNVNIKKMMEHKDKVVNRMTTGVGGLLKANGCTVVNGTATLTGPTTLTVQTDAGPVDYTFNHCVIATGSRPTPFPGLEVDQKTVWDSTGALSQDTIPGSLLCIGGGYIGLELGTFYAKIGAKVTVVEAAPSLLGMVEPELAKVVEKKLKATGADIRVGTFVKDPKVTSKGVEVTLEKDGKTETAIFEKALVTIGRKPNIEGIGLEAAGVRMDDHGFVAVNPQRQTNIPTIFAIGDIAGQPLLAHKGTKEGIVAAEVIAGKASAYDIISMPAVIFTDPEIATVGMTEKEASNAGFEVLTGAFPFAANGKAVSIGEPDGLVKMVADKKTGKLLGVHIVGPEASNLISEAALALEMGSYVEDIALTIHPHPTLGETMMEAAEATLGHAIHIFQRKANPPKAPNAQANA